MSNIINAFGQPADGKSPEPELEPGTMTIDPSTPIGFLAAHVSMIEEKREKLPEEKDGTLHVHNLSVCRVDQKGDDDPSILLMLLPGGQTSILVAGTNPLDASDVVTTIHDGEKMRVEEGGAVGIHLSSGSCFRIAFQLLENLLPEMKPEVRAAADKFLETVRR